MGDNKYIWYAGIALTAYFLIRIIINKGKYRTTGWWKVFGIYISKRWVMFGVYLIWFGGTVPAIAYTAVVTPEVKAKPLHFYNAKIIKAGPFESRAWTPVRIELLNGKRLKLSYTVGHCEVGESYAVTFSKDAVDLHILGKSTPITSEAQRKFIEEHDVREVERYLKYKKMWNRFTATGAITAGIIAIIIITITSFRRTLRVKRRRRRHRKIQGS